MLHINTIEVIMNEDKSPFYKTVSIWFNLVMVIAAVASALYARNANILTEKYLDRTPQLQIKPVQFLPKTPSETQCAIVVEITNYSPFPATDIEWDASYFNDTTYIRQWNLGRIKELEAKKGITEEERGELERRKQGTKKLPILKEEGDSVTGYIGGQCQPTGGDFTILFRLSWKSEHGRTLERNVKYKVVRMTVREQEVFYFLSDE